MLLLRLIVLPAPALKSNARAAVVGLLIEPLMFSVEPALAPIAASAFMVRTPLTVLTPEMLSNWPPKFTPPAATLALVLELRTIGLSMLKLAAQSEALHHV